MLILWVIVAVLTAIIAGAKGRDVIGWLILGGLFPIIALVAVCAMPRR